MKKILFFVAIFIVVTGEAVAQLSLTNAAPTATINFSNTMQTGVGTNASTAYTGAGFHPAPTAATYPGRLNSNAWETKGWGNGNLLFGQTMTNPAHGRGSVSSAVLTEGIYAYTDNPASVANPTLMIQPGDGDFAPGSLTLRVRNNGTTNMTQLQVSYNLFVRNDENSSSSFNFSHSTDNVVFEEESIMDYTSPETADLFEWTMVDIAPSRTMVISGINVAPGGYYYIRWSCADVVLNGGRDEFGLDDITVTAFYGSPAPEINVVGNTLTIVNNDTSPSSADGTIMANAYTGGSNSLITYTIQNLGGADLNISNITITGTNGPDFTIQGTPPTGTIPGVTSVVNVAYLTVKFTPSAPGDRIADVRIYSNDSNENPYFFRIKGTGVIPQPDIEVLGNTAPNTGMVYTNYFFPPNTSNGTLFDPQQLGGAGQTKEFKIRNVGAGANLVLGPDPAITITGAHPTDFTLVAVPSNNTINPGYFQTFSIKFNPTAAGIRTAIVTIQNNDVVNDVFNNDESPFVFIVQGNGVSPEADVSGNGQPIADGSTTPVLSNHTFFDSVNINAAYVDRTFTITNSGTMALTVGAPVISGSTAFTVISAPGASVAAGASTTFVIRFDPFAIGTVNATVTFTNNDSDENPYTFAISGYGLDYVPCATLPVEIIAKQDFEATPPAQNWTYAFAGTNMALTTAGAVAFATSTDGGTTERFLGARAAQLTNSTSGTITFASVSTMDYYNVELNMRLASMSATAIEGADAADKAIIAISTNGGASWSNEIEVRGFSQSKWSFTSGTGTASGVYDGNNGAGIFAPVVNGYVTDQGYSTISITNLPMSSQLRVRVTLNSNSNEIWVVDDVTLFGRREIESTWDGTAWSNGVPTSSVKAIIDGNYDTAVSGNLSACKCEITAGKTVTIQSNQHFSIESDLENFGVINIENGGSLVQRNDFAANAGTINVKRTTTPMKLHDYTYWSSPVQGQTLFNLSPLTPSDKFWHFNSTINNWQGVPSSTIMAPAKGYIVRAPSNFNPASGQVFNAQFAGLTNNGFIQTAVVGGGAWNLLGNPYPSAIDADELLSFNANVGVLGGTLYFWTHNTPIVNNAYNGNDYASYNLTGGVGTQASTPGNNSIPTGMIASGQGFFVAGLTSGQATFNNSMRVTGSNTGFFRPANELVASTASVSPSIEKHRIWLDLSNSQGAFKQTLVGYIQGATNDSDRDFDGLQLNGGNAVGFYSILADQNLSIQGRALPFEDSDLVPLGFSVSTAGEYNISIDRTDGLFEQQGIYLQDNQLGLVHDLQAAPYVFIADQGTYNDRFVLRYTDAALAVGDHQVGNGLQLAVRDHKVHFRASETIAKVEIFDLTGRRVHSQTVNAEEGAIANLLVSQSYIVKVHYADGIIENRKIIFN